MNWKADYVVGEGWDESITMLCDGDCENCQDRYNPNTIGCGDVDYEALERFHRENRERWRQRWRFLFGDTCPDFLLENPVPLGG